MHVHGQIPSDSSRGLTFLQGKASQALCIFNTCCSRLQHACMLKKQCHRLPLQASTAQMWSVGLCPKYITRLRMFQHVCDALQDMGHRLDEAAPVQRRKHWEELADNVVSSAYCGESPGVEADSLREPAASSKVTVKCQWSSSSNFPRGL